MTKLKLLITISNEGYEQKIKEIYSKNKISLSILTHGSGTASSSLLNYFGLAETKKYINLAIIPDYLEIKLLEQINKILNMKHPGTGIVFSLSLTSANKYLLDNFEEKEIKKESGIMNKTKFHLIITIVSEGHLEQAIAAAKRMGAQGGTVIRGRGLGNKDAIKLFGFEIEPGREVILNVVEEDIKNKVMKEITETVGIKTPGKGICISLPVDNAIGINDKLITN